MTYQHKKTQVNTMHRLAVFVAWACVFQMIESLFPNPFPGLRLGLANMVTLVVLFQMGWGSALEVAILRVLISSLMFGTFLSPTFILSLSASLTSTLMMGLLFHLSLRQDILRFGLIGISMAGALTHILTQLLLVYLLLVKHPGVFWLTPWLMLAALATGIITGLLARQICKDLDQSHVELGRKEVMKLLARSKIAPQKHQEFSILSRINPALKIMYVCFVALLVLFFENLQLYSGILLFTLALVAVGKISIQKVWLGVRKMGFFLLTLFLLQIVFTPQGSPLFQFVGIIVTSEGLRSGLLFVTRLLILLLNSNLVGLTTPPEELASHLSRLLSPFRIARFSPSRFSRILMMSWLLIPSFMDQAFTLVRTSTRHLHTLPHLASSLSALILKTMHPPEDELREEIVLAVEPEDNFIDMKKRQ